MEQQLLHLATDIYWHLRHSPTLSKKAPLCDVWMNLTWNFVEFRFFVGGDTSHPWGWGMDEFTLRQSKLNAEQIAEEIAARAFVEEPDVQIGCDVSTEAQ